MADVPGVIKILDWFESTESFFIVMEKFVGQVSILLISPPQLDIEAFLLTNPSY